jgi:hypothetical protein
MEEIWKKYDEKYDVSSFGNIRNKKKLISLTKHKSGYYRCKIHNKSINVHNIIAKVFLNHKTNKTHDLVIDHIDNNKLNNNINNLQIITHRLNCSKDKSTEYTGVYRHGNKYKSSILLNGKSIHLGVFETKYEAKLFYEEAINSIKNKTEIIIKKQIYTSKYKGVSWDTKRMKWRAQLNGKFLGRFNTEIEAYKKTFF